MNRNGTKTFKKNIFISKCIKTTICPVYFIWKFTLPYIREIKNEENA